MKSSLLRAVSVTLPILFLVGCASVRPVASTRDLPPNTIIVRNHTPFVLRVFRNGVAWKSLSQGTDLSYVYPHQDLVLSGVSLEAKERVLVGLEARRVERLGCLVSDKRVGFRQIPLEVGTSRSPQQITLREYSFTD